MADRRPPYAAPSIERIAPFFASSSAKMPAFVAPSEQLSGESARPVRPHPAPGSGVQEKGDAG